MRAIIKEDETYEYAIEIALDWWIKNAPEASWKELISSVYECGEKDTADAMSKKMSEEGKSKLKTNTTTYVMNITTKCVYYIHCNVTRIFHYHFREVFPQTSTSQAPKLPTTQVMLQPKTRHPT